MKKTAEAMVLILSTMVVMSLLISANLVQISPVKGATVWGTYGSGDGQFDNPVDVAVDSSGNVAYVSDLLNHRIQKFSRYGNDYNYLFQWTYTGINQLVPEGIALDSDGFVYVSDWNNSQIEKFDGAGNLKQTIGSFGMGSGQFRGPLGVAVDSAGYVYVLDSQYGLLNRVEKFDSEGSFVAQYGSNGSLDGQFSLAVGVAVDSGGNVYVPDWTNDRIVKFGADEAHTNSSWGHLGSGPGEFFNPMHIAFDGSGNVYVTDVGNSRVERFDSSGEFTGQWGTYGTDYGKFRIPEGIAVDGWNDIYIADTANHRIQKFQYWNTLSVTTVGGGRVNYDPASESYNPGDSVTFNAVADPGWTFNAWSGDVSGPSNPITLSIFKDTDVTATFVQERALIVGNTVEGATPQDPWNYTITHVETLMANFTLPAAGDGSISFGPADLAVGSYLIAQHQKLGYDTSVFVNGIEVSTITENLMDMTLVSLGPNDQISVEFRNAEIPKEALTKTASASDTYPPVKWTYNLPCRVPIPVQAAMNPDINIDGRIDLVKDKPTVIFVNLSNVRSGYGGDVQDTDLVNVGISDSVGLFNNLLPQQTTGLALAQNNITIFYPNAPSIPGNDTITAVVSKRPTSQEPWTTLYTNTKNVTVKETSELALYYAGLNRTGDYGTEPTADYTNMVGNATSFINATYPVPKLTLDTAYKNLPGNQSTPGSSLGILKDCQWLAQLAKLKFPNSVAVGIGIGPNTTAGGSYKNYFAYHGATDAKGNVAVGVSFGPGTRGVVVMDGYYTAAAHELAHTFNLYYGVPEQYLTDNPGKTANGFNAATNEWRTGYDFMGLAPYKTTGITWVNTTSTYEYLFRNTTKVKGDPEILLVNGIIYKDGTVEFPLTWYHLQQGMPDTLPPGDFALRFVASDGSILATTSFDAPFFMQIDPGIGIGENLPDVTGFGKVDTDFAGFAFATAYPQGTAVVQVIKMTDPQHPLGAVNVANIVNVGYYFNGFLQPINNDDSSIFKLGSTVPVKFQLRDFRGSFISTAMANIYVAKVANNVIGTDAEAVSTSAATTGNLFRYDPTSNQYIFNLGTKSLSKGTWQIKVVLDDGTSKTVLLSLK
jgi:DNA-binding beta-propeller fold protein YncE